jgi:uncharacterized repeat protein (TIGR02543 family)
MKGIAYLLMVVVTAITMVSCPAPELDCRVTFDSQQGSAPNPASILVTHGQPYGALVETTREGYLFDGWWTGANGTGVKVEATTQVSISADHTLYAKWVLTVGGIGPAGGYVFYDKGSISDGWRYLEAAPAGWNGAADDPDHCFGYVRDGDDATNEVAGTAIEIGSGAANTAALVAAMGGSTYSTYSGSDTTSAYAAKICDDYTVTVAGTAYDDWFLPSKYELNEMYENLKLDDLGGLSGTTYLSSSEYYFHSAWNQDFSSGNPNFNVRSNQYRVRPARAF